MGDCFSPCKVDTEGTIRLLTGSSPCHLEPAHPPSLVPTGEQLPPSTMSPLRLLFSISIAIIVADVSLAQQLFLFNITSPIEGLPTTCITVLNQALACDPYLTSASPSKWESESVLKSICTSTCDSSWATYLRRVNGACGSSRFAGPDGRLYLPVAEIEPVYETYQLVCLKNA